MLYDRLSQTKFASANEKHYPVLLSDTSPVSLNFYSRSSDEGDMGVYGIAVSGFFSCGFSVILIFTCGIAVSSTD